MTRRTARRLKHLGVALGAGVIFGSLTCVQNLADFVGTGLSLTGTTGVLGPDASQTAEDLGISLDTMADLIELARLRS